jgi:hypothetical protein
MFRHIHLLRHASAATWHNIGSSVPLQGWPIPGEQFQLRTKLSLLNDGRLVGAAFVILLRSRRCLSFVSFFASLINLSFSLRASFWALFSSAFLSLASFASCFLFDVFSLSAAYAWKVSARCTVPDPSGRDVLVELEAV